MSGSDTKVDMGPIDYVVVEFPGSKLKGEAMPILVDLVDRGIIRLLDLVFIKKELDGTVKGMVLADLDGDEQLDLALFEGASSGMLGDDDVKSAGAAIEPGSSAGLLVYENTWAIPFGAAVRRAGGQLVAGGRLSVMDIQSALEESETKAGNGKKSGNGKKASNGAKASV